MNSDEQLQLSNQICFPLYTASRLITKAYKPFLDKLNLTYPQYLVLLVLWEKDGVLVSEIGKKLFLDTNTLSPLLQRMEKAGIVTKKRIDDDERKVGVFLTEKGKKMKNQARPVPEQLLNTLKSEKMELADIVHLKELLTDWISVLSTSKTKK